MDKATKGGEVTEEALIRLGRCVAFRTLPQGEWRNFSSSPKIDEVILDKVRGFIKTKNLRGEEAVIAATFLVSYYLYSDTEKASESIELLKKHLGDARDIDQGVRYSAEGAISAFNLKSKGSK